MTPNWFATFALVIWPVVALCLYLTRPVHQAILWTILGGHMLLPEATVIKFEMIPQFDKQSIPSFCILLGFLFNVRRSSKPSGRIGVTELLILVYIFGPFISAALNGDAILAGERVVPGTGAYDGISAVEAATIALIPFFLGRRFFRESHDVFEIFRVLTIGGLVYSLPLLFEIRFSPQLHYWLYGFYPTDFIQEARDEGFRPMVFMGHGLAASFFAMTSVVAASALWSTRRFMWQLPLAGVASYLSAVLILCKSAAALIYGIGLVAVIRLTKPKFQVRMAQTLVIVALLYPILRSLEVFPTRLIVETATSMSIDRGNSMAFRFENEDRLLERAFQRWIFGWGRYGRSRIYDAETGQDLSVTDGRWIVTMGQFGVLGFLSEFGLLCFTVLRAYSALKHLGCKNDQVLFAALALLVSINVVDLLPNSGLLPWTWLMSGALLGRAEGATEARRRYMNARRIAPAFGT